MNTLYCSVTEYHHVCTLSTFLCPGHDLPPLYLVFVRLQSPSRLRSLSFTTSTPCTFLPPDLTLVFSVLINTQSMWVFIFRKEEGVITSDSNDENNQQRTMTPTTDTFGRGRRCRCHDLLLFESRRCHDFSVVVTKLFSAEYKKVWPGGFVTLKLWWTWKLVK